MASDERTHNGPRGNFGMVFKNRKRTSEKLPDWRGDGGVTIDRSAASANPPAGYFFGTKVPSLR